MSRPATSRPMRSAPVDEITGAAGVRINAAAPLDAASEEAKRRRFWLSHRSVEPLAVLGAHSTTLGGGEDRAIACAVNEGHVAEHIQPSKMRQLERQESAVNVVGDGDAALEIEAG